MDGETKPEPKTRWADLDFTDFCDDVEGVAPAEVSKPRRRARGPRAQKKKAKPPMDGEPMPEPKPPKPAMDGEPMPEPKPPKPSMDGEPKPEPTKKKAKKEDTALVLQGIEALERLKVTSPENFLWNDGAIEELMIDFGFD